MREESSQPQRRSWFYKIVAVPMITLPLVLILGGVAGYFLGHQNIGCPEARQAALTYQLAKLGSQDDPTLDDFATILRFANELSDKASDC